MLGHGVERDMEKDRAGGEGTEGHPREPEQGVGSAVICVSAGEETEVKIKGPSC